MLTLSQTLSFLAPTVWEWRFSEDLEEKEKWLGYLIMNVFVEQPLLQPVC